MAARVHDVAVIGAGPAGLAAATQCASLGLATIVYNGNNYLEQAALTE